MRDKKFKVSVVSAVYNVEKYLEEMIESIIVQTIGFENVQLILVDDNSTDRSGDICDQYAGRYPDNIEVVHKVNGRGASARNEGLRHVRGEYVNFTDADDMLEKNALQLMYDYLNAHVERIDLCAVQVRFFGGKSGDHPLNYRFGKGNRIIDLRKEYDCVQLAINNVLVKSDCFGSRKFEEGLGYAEDARLIVDILLDQMRYGLVDGTSYLYRKREAGDSAIDSGQNRSDYYIPYLEKFILYALRDSQERKGYLPRFVQYTCMYDLQWRLRKNSLVNIGVLAQEEEELYKQLLLKAVRAIDNEIIIQQKYLSNERKLAILLLKEENEKEYICYPNDMEVCIRDIWSASMGEYSTVLEFIDITSQRIVIEGYARIISDFKEVEILFVLKRGEYIIKEYTAEVFDRNEKSSFVMGQMITRAKGFRCSIVRENFSEDVEIQIYLRVREKNIICKKLLFGKFFPLSTRMENSYLYKDGILLTYIENMLCFSHVKNNRLKRFYLCG